MLNYDCLILVFSFLSDLTYRLTCREWSEVAPGEHVINKLDRKLIQQIRIPDNLRTYFIINLVERIPIFDIKFTLLASLNNPISFPLSSFTRSEKEIISLDYFENVGNSPYVNIYLNTELSVVSPKEYRMLLFNESFNYFTNLSGIEKGEILIYFFSVGFSFLQEEQLREKLSFIRGNVDETVILFSLANYNKEGNYFCREAFNRIILEVFSDFYVPSNEDFISLYTDNKLELLRKYCGRGFGDKLFFGHSQWYFLFLHKQIDVVPYIRLVFEYSSHRFTSVYQYLLRDFVLCYNNHIANIPVEEIPREVRKMMYSS